MGSVATGMRVVSNDRLLMGDEWPYVPGIEKVSVLMTIHNDGDLIEGLESFRQYHVGMTFKVAQGG
jgi:hypothetical protein